MKTFRSLSAILALATFCSCSNSTSKKETGTIDSVTIDSGNAVPQIFDEGTSGDTIADIKFEELALSINRLLIYDEEKKMDEIQSDTVRIFIELGESIEGQKITLSTDQLINLKVEQRYETSVSVMDEGPHCDLIDWKHYDSEWKELKSNGKGQFTCDTYTEQEWEKFPEVDIDELKEKVKEQCGVEWYEQAKKIKSLREYPSSVGLSRYFLRVSGQRLDNGQAVTKIIIIEIPVDVN